MFTDKSRYKNVTQYEVTDHRGRTVKVVANPNPPEKGIKGYLGKPYRLETIAQKLNDILQ